MVEADETLAELARLLQRPIVRSPEPNRAKLQLATLYYGSKAVATADAAKRLLLAHDLYEAWLLIRSLYQVAVDFLWLCQNPLVRAERFYDGLAVALDEEAKRYERREALPNKAAGHVRHNRQHAARAANLFTDKRGKIRSEWAIGTIRDRASELGRADPELAALGDMYDLMYKKLSDFEHSSPALAFQYVDTSGDHLRARSRPSLNQETAQELGTLLGLLIGLVIRAGVNVGVLAREALVHRSSST